MDIMLIVVLAVLGALLGSFAAAQVWRLRAHQLIEDEREGEPVDKSELRRLQKLIRPLSRDRSQCLSCHHTLAWYDLVPVFSWLSLRGRCRYCGAAIGATEIIAEIGLAALFVLSYIAWPYDLSSIGAMIPFVVWLTACVVATILFVYDAKWSLLPFALNLTLIALGICYTVSLATLGGVPIDLLSLAGAVILLGGLYLAFSLLGWVGMGDGILGVGLALFLGNWQLAFLTLFMANVLGCIMLIPLYFQKRLHRNERIPFGPFLLLAWVVSMLWGNWIIVQLFGTTSAVLNSLML